MAKIPDRIDSDKEFNELCERMVKGAQMIEDPLNTPEEVETYKAAYDRLWKVCEEYRQRVSGVSFYPHVVNPSETVSAATNPPKPKTRSAVAAWLDDDD